MTTSTKLFLVVLSFFVLGIACVSAGDTLRSSDYINTLRKVPAGEMPLTAAQLIKNASSTNRETIATLVIKAAIEVNPASTALVVGTAAKQSPDMAAIIAGVASTYQPSQAADIARAAASSAPTEAGKIVYMVCRTVPSAYRSVAAAVSSVCPNATQEILNGAVLAIPSLKQPNQQLAGNPNMAGAASSVLDQSNPNATPVMPALSSSSTPIVRGPAITDPFYPLTKTSTNINPGNSGKLPPGGRDYSAP